MMKWISRFLILTFIFNVIAPDLLRAQQVPYSYQWADDLSAEEKDRREKIEFQIADQTSQYQLLDFTSGQEVAAESYGKLLQIFNTIAQLEQKLYPQAYTGPVVHEKQDRTAISATLKDTDVAEMAFRRFQSRCNQEPETLEEWLEQLNDLLEMVDPIFDPYIPNEGEYLAVYATEALLHSLQTAALYASDPEIKNALLEILPQAEARIQRRLASTPDDMCEELIMKRGTFRITLFKLDQLYKQLGEPNPMMAYPVSKKTYHAMPDKAVTTLKLKGPEGKTTEISFADPLLDDSEAPVSVSSVGLIPDNYKIVKIDEKTDFIDNRNMFENFLNDFINELLSNCGNSEAGYCAHEADKIDLPLYNIQMQYTVKYALETAQEEHLAPLIKMLDSTNDNTPSLTALTRPKDNKKQLFGPFNSVKASFFGTMVEHFKTGKVEPKTIKNIQKMLVDLAQSEYIETKSMAIATAATLNNLRQSDEIGIYEGHEKDQLLPAGDMPSNYRIDDKNAPYRFSQKKRDLLIRQAVDLIYLARNNDYYDLNSAQYKKFEDALASSIDLLLPTIGPKMYDPGEQYPGLAPVILFDGTTYATTTVQSIGRAGNTNPKMATYLFTSYTSYIWARGEETARPVYIRLYYNNPLNANLQRHEMDIAFLQIGIETILWALLGPVINGIFGIAIRAMRFAKNAIVVLPKAIRAGRMVNATQKVRAGMSVQRAFADAEKAMSAAEKLSSSASKSWATANKSFQVGEYFQAASDARKAASALRATGKSAEAVQAAKALDNMATKALQMDRWAKTTRSAKQVAVELKTVNNPSLEKMAQEANQLLSQAETTGLKADYALAAQKAEEVAQAIEKMITSPTKSKTAFAFNETASVKELSRMASTYREAAASARSFTQTPGARSFVKAFEEKFVTKYKQLVTFGGSPQEMAFKVAQENALRGREPHLFQVEKGVEKTVRSKPTTNLVYKNGRVVAEHGVPGPVKPTTTFENLSLRDRAFRPASKYRFSTQLATNDGAFVELQWTLKPTSEASKAVQNAKMMRQVEQDIMRIKGTGSTVSDPIKEAKIIQRYQQQQVYENLLAKNPDVVDWWASTDGGKTYVRISPEYGEELVQVLKSQPEAAVGLTERSINNVTLKVLQKPNPLKAPKPENTARRLGSRNTSRATQTTANSVQNAAEQIRVRITRPGVNANEISMDWNKVLVERGGTAKTPLVTASETVEEFNALTFHEVGVENAGTFSMDAANAMLDGKFIPPNGVVKDWARNLAKNNLPALNSIYEGLAPSFKFVARWNLLYSPVAGVWLTTVLQNHMVEEQEEKILDKYDDALLRQTWNLYNHPSLFTPFDKIRDVPYAVTPMDLFNHAGEAFMLPFTAVGYAYDKITGSPTTGTEVVEEQIAELDKILRKTKAIQQLKRNTTVMAATQKELNKIANDYYEIIAAGQELINSASFVTYNGKLDMYDALSADLQDIRQTLNEWEKQTKEASGTPKEKSKKYGELLEYYQSKLQKLIFIYQSKCKLQLGIQSMIASYGIQDEADLYSINRALTTKQFQKGLQTIDSWKGTLDKTSIEELAARQIALVQNDDWEKIDKMKEDIAAEAKVKSLGLRTHLTTSKQDNLRGQTWDKLTLAQKSDILFTDTEMAIKGMERRYLQDLELVEKWLSPGDYRNYKQQIKQLAQEAEKDRATIEKSSSVDSEQNIDNIIEATNQLRAHLHEQLLGLVWKAKKSATAKRKKMEEETSAKKAPTVSVKTPVKATEQPEVYEELYEESSSGEHTQAY